jgi:hypothetical protein
VIGSAQFARHPDVGLAFNIVLTAAHYLARAFDSSALVEPYIESDMSGGAQLLAYNIKYLIPATTTCLVSRMDDHCQDQSLVGSEVSWRLTYVPV